MVDDEDYAVLSRYKWAALVNRHRVYAVRSVRVNGKSTSVLMHRYIMSAPGDMEVDHQDGNGLNNTRANLRLCTPRQNAQNSRDRAGTSRFKGVSWHPSERCWRATIKAGGKALHLGLFNDEEGAALAYDHAARIHFGAFSRTNFGPGCAILDVARAKLSNWRALADREGISLEAWIGGMERYVVRVHSNLWFEMRPVVEHPACCGCADCDARYAA